MRTRFSMTRTLLALGVLGLTACGGGGGTSAPTPPPAPPTFALQVSPAALQVPAGGSGYVTVTVARLNGFQGEVALAGMGFPTGVSASGRVADGVSTVQLPIVVGQAVAAGSFPNLQIEGRSGALVQTTAFGLTVKEPLPPGQGSADFVQASNAPQHGGTYENQALAQENLSATSATGSGGTVQVRHGFLPAGSTVKQ